MSASTDLFAAAHRLRQKVSTKKPNWIARDARRRAPPRRPAPSGNESTASRSASQCGDRDDHEHHGDAERGTVVKGDRRGAADDLAR